jgi:hypothetical protein
VQSLYSLWQEIRPNYRQFYLVANIGKTQIPWYKAQLRTHRSSVLANDYLMMQAGSNGGCTMRVATWSGE